MHDQELHGRLPTCLPTSKMSDSPAAVTCECPDHSDQAPVVRKVDRTIQWINYYPKVIYPVDSAIQLLNNRGQDCKQAT